MSIHLLAFAAGVAFAAATVPALAATDAKSGSIVIRHQQLG